MKFAENSFKRAIRNECKQIGIWNSLCSEITADVLSVAGYDWALLDMEHSPNDLRTVLRQLQAYQAGQTVPVVRPPWNEPVIVKRLLDLGAFTLLFPMIESAEEAERAVASTRYPPHGTRGVSLSQRANRYGRVTDYFQRVEEEICVLVQIETRNAMARVEEIAAVEGVDGVFFGPADLSADLGVIGQPEHDHVRAAMREGLRSVQACGKPAGTLIGNAVQAIGWLEEGFTFVACGSDLNLLAKGADALLRHIRERLGRA